MARNQDREETATLPSSRSIFVVAGEPSGDAHAAHLIEELKERDPGLSVTGFGGPRMAEAGAEILEDLASDAIMGLFPVLKALPRIRSWFRRAEEHLKEERPDALLLVDYPGFNLRLAERARDLGIPVIYYISPQVWAWKERRVEKIRRLVDLLVVILPFEVDFYARHGIEAFYAGHPLADRLARNPADPKLTEALRKGADGPLIGVFPGSRPHVVDSLAPDFLKTAHAVSRRPGLEGVRFLIAAANDRIAARLQEDPLMSGIDADVVVGRSFEVMAAADCALTTSGTTTIELAGHLCPMILAYRVSPVLLTLGRMVVKVPHIGLVNLVAGREIVPEHIGSKSLHHALADDLADLATSSNRRDAMRKGLQEVVDKLESPGSYERTADRIISFLKER